MAQVEFWYEFASTYSYPAAMRIEKVAARKGVAVRWRPFLLGPIFGAQGWNDSPFNIYPAKGKNMWRDLERICADLDIPLRQPPFRFPQNGLKAARIALAHENAPWMPAFSRRVYVANFGEQKDISDDAVLIRILSDLDVDAERASDAGSSPDNKQHLKDQTNEAIARGIYGAPSFTVGEELFWGNDRLERAVDWALR
jgi:2-hydroxychromene-2-carboxylate isomerase